MDELLADQSDEFVSQTQLTDRVNHGTHNERCSDNGIPSTHFAVDQSLSQASVFKPQENIGERLCIIKESSVIQKLVEKKWLYSLL